MKRNPGVFDELKELVGVKKASKEKKVTEEDARNLAEAFHGRPSKGKIEIAERERYRKNLAILGELEELTIQSPINEDKVIPISFSGNKGQSSGDDAVFVCAATENQIEFVDGDQSLEFNTKICRELDIPEEELEKDYVKVGEVYSIVYFADKAHLEGPAYQKKGASYEHMFGEDGGWSPELWYDTLNDKLLLLGGSYSVREEGIKN